MATIPAGLTPKEIQGIINDFGESAVLINKKSTDPSSPSDSNYVETTYPFFCFFYDDEKSVIGGNSISTLEKQLNFLVSTDSLKTTPLVADRVYKSVNPNQKFTIINTTEFSVVGETILYRCRMRY